MNSTRSTLDAYLATVAKTPLLTAEQERVLTRRAAQGDNEARQQLIEANLRFVIKIAKGFQGQGLPLVDLIQEGNLGLMEAIRKFDVERGFRITTYASWWIRLYIQRALEQKAGVISLPINKVEQIKKASHFARQFTKKEGRAPNHEELAAALGTTTEKIQSLLAHRSVVVSLDTSDQEDSLPLDRVLSDDAHEAIHEELTANQMRSRLGRAMRYLSQRERAVINHRFGLDADGAVRSLRQVGQMLSLSPEGVRRIEEQALNKLRRPCVKATMEGFFV